MISRESPISTPSNVYSWRFPDMRDFGLDTVISGQSYLRFAFRQWVGLAGCAGHPIRIAPKNCAVLPLAGGTVVLALVRFWAASGQKCFT
jgi:hypothetical protein